MCGRARCTLNADRVARACGVSAGAASIPTHQMDRYRPSYNVSPGAYLPVVMRERAAEQEDESPAIRCMKWGLVPSFTKKTEKPDHYKMFNARSESIKEKASFRRLVPTNRCLVTVEGFYEWKKDGSRKQPYYIHFKDQRPLVFAALYDTWKNLEGNILYTFTIVTTSSSANLQWLHDRMPVILGNKDSVDAWLNNAVAEVETVLSPYEDADLVWYPVTAAVGKPSFDGPDCIKEIQLKPAGDNSISKFFAKKAEGKEQIKAEPCWEVSPKRESCDGLEKDASTAEGLSNLSKESPQVDNYDGLKGVFQHSADETADRSDYVKKESASASSEAFGGKRDTKELSTDAGVVTEKGSRPLKKARPDKNVDNKQASLLSYFGKA